MSGNSRGKSSRFWQIRGKGRAITSAENEDRTAGSNHPGCNNSLGVVEIERAGLNPGFNRVNLVKSSSSI
jgi:hypothetical protein